MSRPGGGPPHPPRRRGCGRNGDGGKRVAIGIRRGARIRPRRDHVVPVEVGRAGRGSPAPVKVNVCAVFRFDIAETGIGGDTVPRAMSLPAAFMITSPANWAGGITSAVVRFPSSDIRIPRVCGVPKEPAVRDGDRLAGEARIAGNVPGPVRGYGGHIECRCVLVRTVSVWRNADPSNRRERSCSSPKTSRGTSRFGRPPNIGLLLRQAAVPSRKTLTGFLPEAGIGAVEAALADRRMFRLEDRRWRSSGISPTARSPANPTWPGCRPGGAHRSDART